MLLNCLEKYIYPIVQLNRSNYPNGLIEEWGLSNNNTSLQTVDLLINYLYKKIYVNRIKTSNITDGGGADKSSQACDIDSCHIKIDQYKNTEVRSSYHIVGY